MGSTIELNDTLQITTEQGFPAELLDLAKHQQTPIQLSQVQDKIFTFKNKPGARIYHRPPTRCFLVHNIDGKWLHWGWAVVVEQTIQGEQTTSGKFKITKIYNPEYQEQITKHESPEGKSYL
jgi:hypothetical protein